MLRKCAILILHADIGKYRHHCSSAFIAHYTPGIYAEGYIVFVFPFVRSYVRSFVRLFVRSFVRTSVPFVELLQSFTFKQLEWSISHQPLIRKHSYLDHRYPGVSAFIP